MKKISASIVIISIVCVSFLFFVEQVLFMPYIYKTIIKIPLFVIIPFIVKRLLLKEKMRFRIKRNDLVLITLISLAVIMIITVAYLVANSYIDTRLIVNDFNERMKISKTIFIFAGLYTIFVNSFIEEYFFRGFIFQTLDQKGWTKLAYLTSSLLFALYHVGIFMSWFSLPIMFLVLLGLFLGGIIFSYFVKRTSSVLASYMIHMSADIVIVLIGIFGIKLFA